MARKRLQHMLKPFFVLGTEHKNAAPSEEEAAP